MFNDQVFNWVSTITSPTITGSGAVSVSTTDIWYFQFQDVTITRLKYLSPKDTNVMRESFQNTGVHYNNRDELKNIIVEWWIKASSRGVLLQKIDTMNSDIVGQTKYLKIAEWSQSRRCKAVCTVHDYSENRENIDVMNFQFVFETYDYMEDITPEDTLASFSAPYTFNINRSWTAEAKLRLTLSFWSASWVTQLSLNIAWSEILITTAISNWDVIVVDWDELKVLKNWTKIWFVGTIPRLKSVNNSVTITPNGTYSASMIAQYRTAYK